MDLKTNYLNADIVLRQDIVDNLDNFEPSGNYTYAIGNIVAKSIQNNYLLQHSES